MRGLLEMASLGALWSIPDLGDSGLPQMEKDTLKTLFIVYLWIWIFHTFHIIRINFLR